MVDIVYGAFSPHLIAPLHITASRADRALTLVRTIHEMLEYSG